MKHSRKMTPIHIYVASTFFFQLPFLYGFTLSIDPHVRRKYYNYVWILIFCRNDGRQSRPMLCIIPVYKYSTVDIWSDYYLSTCMVCSEVYSICSCSRREYPVNSRDHLLCNLQRIQRIGIKNVSGDGNKYYLPDLDDLVSIQEETKRKNVITLYDITTAVSCKLKVNNGRCKNEIHNHYTGSNFAVCTYRLQRSDRERDSYHL